jgi:hypothetical protein
MMSCFTIPIQLSKKTFSLVFHDEEQVIKRYISDQFFCQRPTTLTAGRMQIRMLVYLRRQRHPMQITIQQTATPALATDASAIVSTLQTTEKHH